METDVSASSLEVLGDGFPFCCRWPEPEKLSSIVHIEYSSQIPYFHVQISGGKSWPISSSEQDEARHNHEWKGKAITEAIPPPKLSMSFAQVVSSSLGEGFTDVRALRFGEGDESRNTIFVDNIPVQI
ncbi:hypothetical protein U1Q18_014241 [Sarracenia purpurea var. burkii]